MLNSGALNTGPLNTVGGGTPLAVSEGLSLASALGAIYPNLLTDTAQGHEVLVNLAHWVSLLADTAQLPHTAVSAWHTAITTQDACSLHELTSYLAGWLVTEGVTLQTTLGQVLYLLPKVLEQLQATATEQTTARYLAAMLEATQFAGRIYTTWMQTLLDGLKITPSASYTAQALLRLLDGVRALDASLSRQTAVEVLALALALSDSPAHFWAYAIAEGVKVGEALSATAAFYAALLDSLSGQASTTGAVRVLFSVLDGPALAADLSLNQVLQQVLTESLRLRVGFVVDGEVYTGWVMNTQTFAVSQYQNFNFNSFAHFQGADLALNANGLYRLGGGTDDGANIMAALRTATMDFDAGQRKRMKAAYLGVAATGALVLKTLTDDDVERWYGLSVVPAGLHTERVLLARGVQSRYWAFELDNTGGSDFRLDSIELLPVVLDRRI